MSSEGYQYQGNQPSGPDGTTRLMSIALVGLTLTAGGLFGYNTLMSKNIRTVMVEAESPKPTLQGASDVGSPVAHYIKEWAGSRNRTEARKYARTLAVMKQCGIMYRRVSKTYEAENLENYALVKMRIVPQPNTVPAQQTVSKSSEINADMFKLDIATGTGNSMVAAAKMASALEDPFPEEAYATRPPAEECNVIKQMALQGELAVRI